MSVYNNNIVFPESPVELVRAAQAGKMQVLPLYKYDTFYFEKRAAGWTIADLKRITWFAQSRKGNQGVSNLDVTLCSQEK